MRINFSKADTDNIIKLRSVDNISINKIADIYSVGYRAIKRVLIDNGISIKNSRYFEFSDDIKKSIINAYESGIGANGINSHLNLSCSSMPVIAYLKTVYPSLRNRSEQQFARMSKATPQEIAKLTTKAHESRRGSKATHKELINRAKAKEGKVDSRSRYEPIFYTALSKSFNNVIPNMAIDTNNVDFGIGNIAVEIFGGGWSYTNKARLDRYIKKTKHISNLGFHTIFVIIPKNTNIIDTDELIKVVKQASSLPAFPSQYWMIWGDTNTSIGLSDNINNKSFVCPFVNIRDRTTGRYIRVSK